MLEDLRRVRILFLRDVAGLFEQRQIDVGFNIALRTGLAITVPGAAEVAALFAEADTLHSRPAQARSREQATETASDNQYLDFVFQRLSSESRIDIGIIDVVPE